MSERTCSVVGCGNPLYARGWCRKHYYRWYVHGPGGVVLPPAECGFCGEALPAERHPLAEYCGRECRVSANAAKVKHSDAYSRRKADQRRRHAERLARTVKTCPGCGVEFTPAKSLRQEWCSKECNSRHRGPDSLTRLCEVEGCERPYRARGMCNLHYRRVLRAEGRLKTKTEWTPERKARWQKRRAIKTGAEADLIVAVEVFERDGWVCGVCEEPVDRALEWPDPGSASLDHVVPLSKGGSHTCDNVQLAHVFCNLSKGDALTS